MNWVESEGEEGDEEGGDDEGDDGYNSDGDSVRQQRIRDGDIIETENMLVARDLIQQTSSTGKDSVMNMISRLGKG
jgi:hypothetical protein